MHSLSLSFAKSYPPLHWRIAAPTLPSCVWLTRTAASNLLTKPLPANTSIRKDESYPMLQLIQIYIIPWASWTQFSWSSSLRLLWCISRLGVPHLQNFPKCCERLNSLKQFALVRSCFLLVLVSIFQRLPRITSLRSLTTLSPLLCHSTSSHNLSTFTCQHRMRRSLPHSLPLIFNRSKIYYSLCSSWHEMSSIVAWYLYFCSTIILFPTLLHQIISA